MQRRVVLVSLILLTACAKSRPSASGASTGPGSSGDGPASASVDAGSSSPPDDAGAGDAANARPGEILASDQHAPGWLTRMGGQLYWVLDNALMTMPVAGGPPKELAHGLVQPDSLRIDDTSAYWLAYGEQSGIHKVSLDGGSVTDLVIASTPTPIRQLALDGAYVYYTNAPSGSVVRVDKSGGVPTTIASGLEGPSDITADASGVYVVESGEKGAITRIPNGVDPAVRLAHDQAEPRSIVLTATEVYWIDGGVFDTATQTFIGAAVMKVSKAGGPPVEVAKADAANALFADGAQLYYTVGNAIVRAPASGGGASVFAEVVKPRAIAADATYVYWASAGSAAKGYLDGEVRRFKK